MNEIDDDCDGSIDEDFAKGEPCSIGLGVCEQGELRDALRMGYFL